jgi:hypothetical protein
MTHEHILSEGTKIIFNRDIYEDACGDHPRFILARKGNNGTITKYANGKYHVKWEHWQSASFLAEYKIDFHLPIEHPSEHAPTLFDRLTTPHQSSEMNLVDTPRKMIVMPQPINCCDYDSKWLDGYKMAYGKCIKAIRAAGYIPVDNQGKEL